MRITRYVAGQTNVQELQAQRSAAITPQQAAAGELAKFGAISSAADSASRVFSQIATIQADEELSDAVIGYAGDIALLDEERASKLVELDDSGNIIYNADEELLEESQRRKELAEERRKGLQSKSALRRFDEHIGKTNVERDISMRDEVRDRSIAITLAKGEDQIEKFRQMQLWDLARMRAVSMLENGSMSPKRYKEVNREINIDRDIGIITNVLANPDATDAQIEILTDSLTEGVWDSMLGLNEPTIALDDVDVVRLQGQLFAHEASIDKRRNDEIKVQQDSNFNAEMRLLAEGQSSAARVSNLPDEYVSSADRKWLWTQANSDTVKSDTAAVNGVSQSILELVVDGGTTEDINAIKQQIKQDGIKPDDALDLTKELNNAVNLISESKPDRRLLEAAQMKIAGVTTEQQFMGDTSDKPSERIAMEQMSEEFWAQKMMEGSEFNAHDWLRDNRLRFYKMALVDTLAKRGQKVDVFDMDEDEAHRIMEARALAKVKSETIDWDELPEDQRKIFLLEEMADLELLVRYAWSTD